MTRKSSVFGFAVALGVVMMAAGAGAGMPAPRQVLPASAIQPAALPAGTTTAMPAEDDTPPAPDPDSNPPVLAYAGPGWG